MGFWREEYEEKGWKEYVEKVIRDRFGGAIDAYEVTEEDKRQLEHVMAVLDDESDNDESFEYHTPCSDVSFEYNTPGPKKKIKRISDGGNTSFFPEFGSQEFALEPVDVAVSMTLCQRLANLSPITSNTNRTPHTNDVEPSGSFTFDMPQDETVDHNGGGEISIDEPDIKATVENTVVEVEDMEPVDTLNAESTKADERDGNIPQIDVDINMDDLEQFEELENQPDEIGSDMELTVLLDHFEFEPPLLMAPSAEIDVPTQRRHSIEDEYDFPFERTPPTEKPLRRRLRVSDDTNLSSSDDDLKISTKSSCLQHQNFPNRGRCSDISSIDEINSTIPDTQPYETVEAPTAINLARVNPARSVLTLEEHQTRAVEWMQSRERRDATPFRGGILADEMGLGKTICCLALIGSKSSNTSNPTKKRPSLIITPLSLVHQWEQEIKDKTTLSVGLYHGANRKRFQRSPEFYAFDIILTTYDTIRVKETTYARPSESDITAPHPRWIQTKRRRDSKLVASKLHKIYWERVILDEAHLISNSITARAQAACKLSGRARWCVTGTPIQNRLEDVHTLFQFLGLPEIENEAHLQSLLDKCMLRRLKSNVSLPLPAKVEHLIKLNFQTEAEKNWYASVRQTTREQVQQHLQERRPARHIFELLLRLRQVCNSSRLLPPNCSQLPTLHMSTKMQVLFDHLLRAKRDMIKVLVISQWTSFLDLLQDHLAVTNPLIRCGRLDGRMSAASRHQTVQMFQSSNQVNVLFMSVRCGALGLNLTKARYVFIMEPCWNPSLEAQAIDRTHRIGQDHPVQVYRFLMQNTIEEKIYELQQQKRNLATTVLNPSRKNSSRRATNDWVALMA